MDQTERRRHQRYKPANEVIIQQNLLAGQIINISKGGLAFRYLSWESSNCTDAINEQESVSLLMSRNNLFLQNIPCRTVADQVLPNDSLWIDLYPRQRHLAFASMPHDQQSNLIEFITRMIGI